MLNLAITSFGRSHSVFLKFCSPKLTWQMDFRERFWFWDHILLISAIFTWERRWVLSIMLDRPVRDQWEYPKKMERHFPTNPPNKEEWFLPFFIPFPNSLRKWREVWQWTSLSKWNGKIWSECCNHWTRIHVLRTTSRGGFKYSGRKELKRTFPFDFGPKFLESLE